MYFIKIPTSCPIVVFVVTAIGARMFLGKGKAIEKPNAVRCRRSACAHEGMSRTAWPVLGNVDCASFGLFSSGQSMACSIEMRNAAESVAPRERWNDSWGNDQGTPYDRWMVVSEVWMSPCWAWERNRIHDSAELERRTDVWADDWDIASDILTDLVARWDRSRPREMTGDETLADVYLFSARQRAECNLRDAATSNAGYTRLRNLESAQRTVSSPF